MNLKDLINNYRYDNNQEKYSVMFQKIIDMLNNNGELFVVGKLEEKESEPTFVTKTINNRKYLLVFTDDAKLFKTPAGKDRFYMAVKISNIFNILLQTDLVEGLVLNDGDGKGNVIIHKDIVRKLIELQ